MTPIEFLPAAKFFKNMKTKTILALALTAATFAGLTPVPAQQNPLAERQRPVEVHPPDMDLIDDQKSEIGFMPIFNGKDLTGWDGSPDLWSVKEGVITGQTSVEHPAKENTFLIWTNGVVDDFELRCSFKLTPGDAAAFANSGVQYRSRVVKPSYWVVSGYQADMENGKSYTGNVYEEKGRGTMAQRGEKVLWGADGKKQVVGSVGDAAAIEASIKKDGWNDYTIIAKGNHIVQILNGHVTVDLTDEEDAKAAKSGIVALQIHAGHPMMCQFKNIRIKSLK